MAQTYQHSRVFGQLKSITESIQGNYTSAQYLEVLDFLLYQAIEPLVQHTQMYPSWLAQIQTWYSTVGGSRKITTVDLPLFQTTLCMFLVAPPQHRLSVLKKLKLERNLLTMVVDDFLSLASSYRQLSEALMYPEQDRGAITEELERIQAEVGCTDSDMYSMFRHVYVWYSYYLDFRGFLIEKFTRLALMKSRETYQLTDYEMPLDDIIQHYMMAIGKAIDKFDIELGSLASYVGQWFLDARTNVRKEVSRTDDLLADGDVDYDEHTPSDDDVCFNVERKQTIDLVRKLAKIADPVGLARLKLGIEEVAL